MTDRELMEQALEALGLYAKSSPDVTETMAALCERLAQPEQEPVAWIYSPLIGDGPKERRLTFVHPSAWGTQLGLEITPLYAAPKSRQWQRLTDEEIDTWNIVGHESLREFVRAIEAKLKEKNT